MRMSLTSSHLDAFIALAKASSFTVAAEKLFITQSALSQRIKNLEEELGLTLVIRTSQGVKLTEAGEKLMRYGHTRNSLESELLQDISAKNKNNHSGSIRLGAYSSILRSVLIPALSPLFNENLIYEMRCAHMSDLHGLLSRGEVDYIILDHTLERENLETIKLGSENFVVIESRKHKSPAHIFLDNNAEDLATELFFRAQGGKKPKYKRSYFDDCYGIIEAAAQGLGRAVMPEHLVKNNNQVKICKGFKPYQTDVVLHFYKQPFYTQLHNNIVKNLTTQASQYLKS
jgi:DNA-binding transcriptional LysR family regulator